ncbi:hypothetical protein HAX54_050944 [Datura stramonium]|uniref:Uncharacterized protein n=1 Tax=Datura stramonium TaxID=4076 RepID=A0ABS8SX66_DATST|nr:hypothetical protein [Datura stramonium]
MTTKLNNGKGVPSSSHGSKRAKRYNEEEHNDVSLPQQPMRRYGLHWSRSRLHALGLDFVFNALGDYNLNMVREFLANWEPKESSNQVKIRVPGKHVNHVTRERFCLVYELMAGMPINANVIIKNVLRRARVKKGQIFGFGGLLTRILRGHQIKKEEADYRLVYDPRGIDVTKTKEPKDIHGLVLSINECNAWIETY